MADYIYLLDNQLSPAQRSAIAAVRDVVRAEGLTLFLTGGAVRDLTVGARVRDLDLTVQGNPAKLKKQLEKAGARIDGERPEAQTVFLWFSGGVRVELAGATTVEFPKPGKPVYKPASILDDLRSRRDFTANAMAISLNDGSYGLLMDPLNGVADIENRELRLVSNYGFIEDPVRLMRGVRLNTRLGWQFEEKTAQRYATAKEEGYVSALSPWMQGYELEEIAHEEDPVRTLRALEAEGWMKSLFPAWGSAKANSNLLNDLQMKNAQLNEVGILSDASGVQFAALTAKLQPKEISALKKMFPRQGFVERIDSLEKRTKEFQDRFTAKESSAASAAWKLAHASDPEVVLSLFAGGKGTTIQNKYKGLVTDWPTAKQRLPYQMMQEMRITPDLPVYQELLDKLFFELMDNKLGTPEEMKAYLEPFSPPAPPPPVTLRRPRKAKETKASRAKAKKAAEALEAQEEGAPEAMSLPDEVGDEPVGSAPSRDGGEPKPAKKAAAPAAAKNAVAPEKSAPAKAAPVKSAPSKKAAPVAAKAAAKKAAAPAKKAVAKKAVAPAKKSAPVKSAAKKTVAKKSVPAKKVPVKAVKKAAPAKKAVAKKTVAAKKAPAKAVKKAVAVKKSVAKKAAKKR